MLVNFQVLRSGRVDNLELIRFWVFTSIGSIVDKTDMKFTIPSLMVTQGDGASSKTFGQMLLSAKPAYQLSSQNKVEAPSTIFDCKQHRKVSKDDWMPFQKKEHLLSCLGKRLQFRERWK